ncbi:MAG: VWA domain-containing protein [Pseudomonadota bacterium]
MTEPSPSSMSRPVAVPRAAMPLLTFAPLLRANGFPASPDQSQSFVTAVGLLGPRRMDDLYRAACAIFGPAPDRIDAFDALYRAHFLGQSLSAPAPGPEEEQAFEPEDGAAELFDPTEENTSGAEATAVESLSGRSFSAQEEVEALRRFRRMAQGRLPRRTSRRLRTARQGTRPHLRRALKDAVKRDGELLTLPVQKRRTAQRRLLVLIDISGSMKTETDRSLRFAHALMGVADRCEVFTLGTRLTRITRPLKLKHRTAAMEGASAVVSDWDGGTRLGDALAAFLSVPRYAGFARSACVIVLSDGLERGEPAPLVSAVDRLSRLAWRILWLSPLAADPSYRPQTEAMRHIAQMVGRIGSGASLPAVVDEVLNVARPV